MPDSCGVEPSPQARRLRRIAGTGDWALRRPRGVGLLDGGARLYGNSRHLTALYLFFYFRDTLHAINNSRQPRVAYHV